MYIGGILNGMNIIGMMIFSVFEIRLYRIELVNSLFTIYTEKRKINVTSNQSLTRISKDIKEQKEKVLKDNYMKNNLKLTPTFSNIIFSSKLRCFRLGNRLDNKTAFILKTMNHILEFSQTILLQKEICVLKNKAFISNNNGYKFGKYEWYINNNGNLFTKTFKKEKTETYSDTINDMIHQTSHLNEIFEKGLSKVSNISIKNE